MVRMLGNEAGMLKQQLGEIISIIRAAALGRPAEVPRVWRC